MWDNFFASHFLVDTYMSTSIHTSHTCYMHLDKLSRYN